MFNQYMIDITIKKNIPRIFRSYFVRKIKCSTLFNTGIIKISNYIFHLRPSSRLEFHTIDPWYEEYSFHTRTSQGNASLPRLDLVIHY